MRHNIFTQKTFGVLYQLLWVFVQSTGLCLCFPSYIQKCQHNSKQCFQKLSFKIVKGNSNQEEECIYHSPPLGIHLLISWCQSCQWTGYFQHYFWLNNSCCLALVHIIFWDLSIWKGGMPISKSEIPLQILAKEMTQLFSTHKLGVINIKTQIYHLVEHVHSMSRRNSNRNLMNLRFSKYSLLNSQCYIIYSTISCYIIYSSPTVDTEG